MTYGDSYRPPETYYAKGQYYALSGRSPFKRHIYPLPDGAWLGLHATVDIGGRCKFGPDIEWTPGIDYSFQPEKLEKFLDFIRSYYPGLDASRLHPDYTGVRPKLYREGEPVPDFAIHGPAQHGQAGPRRPLRHREPWAYGRAGDRGGCRRTAAATGIGASFSWWRCRLGPDPDLRVMSALTRPRHPRRSTIEARIQPIDHGPLG